MLYRDKIILRPQELFHNPEVIRRLGLITINIGGSTPVLVFFVTKSITKNGDISSIVPFVSHVNHPEHDVDVIVTEKGIADLRGLAPKERATRT